jgi:hypothetical protein
MYHGRGVVRIISRLKESKSTKKLEKVQVVKDMHSSNCTQSQRYILEYILNFCLSTYWLIKAM